MVQVLHYPRMTLGYGNYGIFLLIMGNAGCMNRNPKPQTLNPKPQLSWPAVASQTFRGTGEKKFKKNTKTRTLQPNVVCFNSALNAHSRAGDPAGVEALGGLELWALARWRWEFPKIRGTLFWDPYSKDPTL